MGLNVRIILTNKQKNKQRLLLYVYRRCRQEQKQRIYIFQENNDSFICHTLLLAR